MCGSSCDCSRRNWFSAASRWAASAWARARLRRSMVEIAATAATVPSTLRARVKRVPPELKLNRLADCPPVRASPSISPKAGPISSPSRAPGMAPRQPSTCRPGGKRPARCNASTPAARLNRPALTTSVQLRPIAAEYTSLDQNPRPSIAVNKAAMPSDRATTTRTCSPRRARMFCQTKVSDALLPVLAVSAVCDMFRRPEPQATASGARVRPSSRRPRPRNRPPSPPKANASGTCTRSSDSHSGCMAMLTPVA